MDKYNCEKCGKEFIQKNNYNKHINKKNPCIFKNKEILEKNIIDQHLTIIDSETIHKEIEDGIRDAMLALLKQPTQGFTYTPAAMDKLSLLYVKIGQRYCDTEALKEKRVFQQMYGFYMMVRDAQNRIIDMLRKGVLK